MSESVTLEHRANDASEELALERGAKDAIARRAGRIAFGLVLIAGVAALGAFSGYDGASGRGPVHAWHIVVATWLGALFAARTTTAIVGSGSRPRKRDAFRRSALAVPAVGIALMLPITLHMPFVLIGGADVFDGWVCLSGIVVGHTHALFAALVFVRAQALTSDRADRKPVSIATIYLVCVAISAIPYAIPAVFVAVTGLPILVLLHRMESIAQRDREDSRDVPFAIARAR